MTTACNNCKKCVPLKKLFECAFCRKDEDTEEDEDEDEVKDLVETKTEDTPIMFCRNCSDECFGCEERGCEECIEIVCCDCGVHMCNDCRNNETLCGCYGKCFWCGREVNRGSDGWPCWECDRWGCYDCRLGDNDCKECNPNGGEELIYSSSDEDEVSTDVINAEATNVEEAVPTEVINVINAEAIDNSQNTGSEED